MDADAADGRAAHREEPGNATATWTSDHGDAEPDDTAPRPRLRSGGVAGGAACPGVSVAVRVDSAGGNAVSEVKSTPTSTSSGAGSALTRMSQAVREEGGGDYRLLAVCLFVVYIRYSIATFMSPFFPDVCKALGIHSAFIGLIFAAYPTGIALTGAFGTPLILRLGTRTAVVVGLLVAAGATLVFGLLPDIVGCAGSDLIGPTADEWGAVGVQSVTSAAGGGARLQAAVAFETAALHTRTLGGGGHAGSAMGVGVAPSTPGLSGATPPDDRPHCDGDALKWSFLVSYFLNGLVGSLSDTGVIVVCGDRFKRTSGLVMTLICTVSGVGTMSGPPLGGLLYSAFDRGDGFRWTFVVFASLCALAVPVAGAVVPQERVVGDDADDHEGGVDAEKGGWYAAGADGSRTTTEGDGGNDDDHGEARVLLPTDERPHRGPAVGNDPRRTAGGGRAHSRMPSIRDVVTRSSALSLGSIVIGGAANGCLDPTLSFRLSGLSPAVVGLYFTISSLTYTIMSVPVGWLIEKAKTRESVGDSRVYKLGLAGGFAVVAVAFVILGPLRLPGEAAHTSLPALETHWAAGLAMFVKGLGGVMNNCCYPDLLMDVPRGARRAQAKIDGLWNAMYALGWAAGPALGGVVYAATGFPGLASIIAAVVAGYACLLFAAAWSTWGVGGYRARPAEVQEAREAAVVAAMVVALAAAAKEEEKRKRERW